MRGSWFFGDEALLLAAHRDQMGGFESNVTFVISVWREKQTRKSDGISGAARNADNAGVIYVTVHCDRYAPTRLAWSFTASTLARVMVTVGDLAP